MSTKVFEEYTSNLKKQLELLPLDNLRTWADDFKKCWMDGHQLFICGNGGSAGNAIHLANDYLYGISPNRSPAMRVTALTANPSVLTCLGNDIGYEKVFSQQLKKFAEQRKVGGQKKHGQ